MKVITLKCPNCDADLEVSADRDDLYCSYCGTHILLEDENKKPETVTVHVIRDEARLKELELEEARLNDDFVSGEEAKNRLNEMAEEAFERKEKKKRMWPLYIGIVLMFVFPSISGGLEHSGANTSGIDGLTGAIVLFVIIYGVYLFATRKS